jgi:acetyl esterase/lipase
VLLFLHGGGYELGSLRSDGELAARLGRASGMRVLFPEYRLAPEHPFPAAIDDVLAAWRWLRTDQDLSARSMAVAGDSAGGGLAVALLVATRDAGHALPAAAALMSPTVDLTSSGASMTEHADQQPKPGSTSPWRSARACPTSTSSCSAPPRQPRPPSRSGRSCGPGFNNQTVIRPQASPVKASPVRSSLAVDVVHRPCSRVGSSVAARDLLS